MQIHESVRGIALFYDIDKLFAEVSAISDVIGTAAPLPLAFRVFTPDFIIATAFRELPFTTGSGHSIGHSGSAHCMNVCLLSTVCRIFQILVIIVRKCSVLWTK